MVRLKNVEVHNLERSLIASGNPMTLGEIDTLKSFFNINDMKRGKNLGSVKQGSGHDNFLSGILVTFDIKYPQYWSMEFQRYHFAQIVSSQSKMHKLIKARSREDFNSMFNKYVDIRAINLVNELIDSYNNVTQWDREVYDTVEEWEQAKYERFMRVISNLPMGFELWMTVTTNYLQLKTIYNQRLYHKLKEDWGAFTKMCEDLPMFIELINKEEEE